MLLLSTPLIIASVWAQVPTFIPTPVREDVPLRETITTEFDCGDAEATIVWKNEASLGGRVLSLRAGNAPFEGPALGALNSALANRSIEDVSVSHCALNSEGHTRLRGVLVMGKIRSEQLRVSEFVGFDVQAGQLIVN